MGQLDLSLGDYDSGPMRQMRLWHFLETANPSLIAFEGREFSIFSLEQTGLKAANLSASLRTTVAVWAHLHDVPCYGIPVGHIKQRATGMGNAGKEALIRACNSEFGTSFDANTGVKLGVDNICDAAWVLAIAIEDYGSTLTMPIYQDWPSIELLQEKLRGPQPLPAKKKGKKTNGTSSEG